MNKKLIRLTESDLHNIVKESVGNILREIRYGGETLHGNNGVDWYALHAMRGFRNDLKYNGESNTPEDRKSGRNYANACALDKDIHDSSFSDDGCDKAIRMADNLGLGESTIFDRKLPEVIEFLEELARRLDDGLLTVNGFEGGNRMFATSDLLNCVSWLKKMNGNLVAV